MYKKYKLLLLYWVAISFSMPSAASSGIALSATRVIYHSDAKQASIAVINAGDKDRYLINSWIENADGDKHDLFVVTPPLFVSEADTENTIRLIYAGPALPDDRESLFWLNVKAIPSVDKQRASSNNILQLAILSRIKIFYRPRSIAVSPDDAFSHLSFKRSGDKVIVSNSSPYYITLVNFTAGGQAYGNVMLAPKSTVSKELVARNGVEVSWQTINDYGALTPIQKTVL